MPSTSPSQPPRTRCFYGREPGIASVAEESTAWPGVSRPTYVGGLGFGFKWNMGWMHDTLGYFARESIYRRYHHHEPTFSLMYAFSENFVLPLSHDEVVHGKGSMINKMIGDRWQQFANLRARSRSRRSPPSGSCRMTAESPPAVPGRSASDPRPSNENMPAVLGRSTIDLRSSPAAYPWERPLGARPRADGTTEFRVWAPRADSLALRVGGREVALHDAGHGVFEVTTEASAGEDYVFVVNGYDLPDPCTRWQPGGLRAPSRVLDPATFEWSDSGFRPAPLADQVLYELHVGTFSRAGTFGGAIEHLRALAEVGVTAIELMPVAEFPGARGWGYDGVYLSAAHSAYGGPEALARLVDAAHGAGLSVVLDVVYNHLGASGVQATEAFGHYFTDRYETPWGRAINFDGEQSDPVREWVLQSAEGWVRDFHVDGLRLDAIHAIVDSSPEHLVGAVARRVHAVSPAALVIAESGLNDPRAVRAPDRGGHGCDAVWADDFHHALRALLTGECEGYYAEFGAVGQLAKAFRRPHVHDGQYPSYRKRRFGAPPEDVAPERFVVFDQNHDQVGNRAYGDRLPREAQPLAAFCTLLGPGTPMLFMGEEYGERAPFQFFSDHIDEEIAVATRQGRRREFAAFAQFGEQIPDPQSPETFEASKLTRERDPRLAELYRQLLAARRRMPHGEVGAVELDEAARWLLVTRAPFELACNFSDRPALVPCRGGRVVLSTHEAPALGERGIGLEPLSGALIAP